MFIINSIKLSFFYLLYYLNPIFLITISFILTLLPLNLILFILIYYFSNFSTLNLITNPLTTIIITTLLFFLSLRRLRSWLLFLSLFLCFNLTLTPYFLFLFTVIPIFTSLVIYTFTIMTFNLLYYYHHFYFFDLVYSFYSYYSNDYDSYY